jgi:hypothetical protein
MPYRHTGVCSGERLRSKAICVYAASFCVSGSVSRRQVLESGARRVSGGYAMLGRAGCQEKLSVDADVTMSFNRPRLIERCKDLFPLPAERGKNEVPMSRVHGTSRFRAWTARLCVVRRTEDTEEGSGGVRSFPRRREKKAEQSQPGSAKRHCWCCLCILVSFFALFTPS